VPLQGYNKRATVLYLLGRFQESVEECRTVLSLNPYHFGAASGMGLCYMQVREWRGVVVPAGVILKSGCRHVPSG
jgi:hypothetical protein